MNCCKCIKDVKSVLHKLVLFFSQKIYSVLIMSGAISCFHRQGTCEGLWFYYIYHSGLFHIGLQSSGLFHSDSLSVTY